MSTVYRNRTIGVDCWAACARQIQGKGGPGADLDPRPCKWICSGIFSSRRSKLVEPGLVLVHPRRQREELPGYDSGFGPFTVW